jgi:RimJ/RimL family protein N-acetyltransferase
MIDLLSERLVQTKFTADDYEDFRKLEIEPKVVKYISGEVGTEEKIKEVFERLLSISNKYEHLGFCRVLSKSDNSFMGLSKITAYENKVNPVLKMAEVGYSLLPEYWGKGIATEIVARLIEYAKELGDIYELTGGTHPDNTASIKVLTKQGFTFFDTGFFNKQPSVIYKLKIK